MDHAAAVSHSLNSSMFKLQDGGRLCASYLGPIFNPSLGSFRNHAVLMLLPPHFLHVVSSLFKLSSTFHYITLSCGRAFARHGKNCVRQIFPLLQDCEHSLECL